MSNTFVPEVLNQTVYEDGSGIALLVRTGSLLWSASYTSGKIKIFSAESPNRQSGPVRSVRERCIEIVRKIAQKMIDVQTPAWHAAHAEMYRD